jgi:hypothetical protein
MDIVVSGDLRSLQVALRDTETSPLAIDECGESLLHVGVLTPSHSSLNLHYH